MTDHTQPIDANALEIMAKNRPDGYFLKGSGVLKLISGIRQLERELRSRKEAMAQPITETPAAEDAATQAAWMTLESGLQTDDWTAFEARDYRGFFGWGWEARRQYDVPTTAAHVVQPEPDFYPHGAAHLLPPMQMNRRQLLQALEMTNNGEDVSLQYKLAGQDIDGDLAPEGIYCWATDQSQEYSLWLNPAKLKAEIIEIEAKAIYERWSTEPGWVPWEVRGNLHEKQNAREMAARIHTSKGGAE